MKKFIKQFIFVNIGLIILALSLHLFLIPNNLAVGGVTGFAMVLNTFISGLTVGQLILIMNVILLIIGFIFIGMKFVVNTIYSSLALSSMMILLEKFYPVNKPFTDDLFIELIFGIVIGAVGMAIVFEQNASTGGTDIIAKILNKYFHFDIGKSLLMADFIVTILAAYTFGFKMGMYAVLGIIMNGIVIDTVIEGFNICKKVEIVSFKGDKIKEFIINELGRGATLYIAKGAYTNDEKEVITTIVNKKEFIRLKNYIKETDRKAFVTTYNIHETLGEGFKDIME